ncbi:MAG: lipid biosynthesis B12-binding/radical SAM protein [Pseudomonadota bacterium]
MRVLLISANTLTIPYPVYPVGLDYVAAAVAPSHDVRICDMNVLGGLAALKSAVTRYVPDVVGISIRNVDNTDATDPAAYLGTTREIVAAVRQASSAIVVVGGSGFTLFPEDFLAALGADFGIIGEGERLPLLLDALAGGLPVEGIPGVIRPGGTAAFPPPWAAAFSRHSVSPGDHREFYLCRGGMLNLQTKRGCRHRCIYCTYPHIEGRRLRLEDPSAVARTALALERAGARYLFVTDSVFNMDTAHNRAVADAFRREGLSIPWGAFFSPGNIAPGYFEHLAAAGLKHVEFGTESLSDAVLKAYRKPFRARDVQAAHSAALAAGLHVAHYFLLGGPGECVQTLDETLSCIDKLRKSVLFLFSGMRIYPHTALYGLALEEGQIAADQNLLAPVFYRSPHLDDGAMIARVKQRAAGRPNWVIGAGGKETAAILSKMYEKGYTGPLWEYLIR